MRYATALATMGMIAMATPAVAQDSTISQSFLSTMPIENVPAFETAYLRHVDWHRNQNDPWRWDVWATTTGELGTYIVITDDHTWSDFDSPPVDPAADAANAIEQFGSLVTSVTSAFVRLLPDVSRPADPTESIMLAQVFDYKIKPGKEADFMALVRTYHNALEEANWEQNYIWLANVSGVEAQYILVLQYENHASMAPAEPSVQAILEEAIGRQETQIWNGMVGDMVESVTERLWQYRPDLSYGPGM